MAVLHIHFLILFVGAEQSLDMVYYLGSTLFLQQRYDYFTEFFCLHTYVLSKPPRRASVH